MGCVAADDAAEDDDGVVASGVDEGGCGEAEFYGAGNVEEFEVDALLGEQSGGAVAQGGGDVAVPLGGDYGYALVGEDGERRGGLDLSVCTILGSLEFLVWSVEGWAI